MGSEGVYAEKIFFLDYTRMLEVSDLAFLTLVISTVLLTVFMIFDDKILYKCRRN